MIDNSKRTGVPSRTALTDSWAVLPVKIAGKYRLRDEFFGAIWCGVLCPIPGREQRRSTRKLTLPPGRPKSDLDIMCLSNWRNRLHSAERRKTTSPKLHAETIDCIQPDERFRHAPFDP
jgi:hypothetical protein